MANIDLSKYGITGSTDIVYNPSYELLFEEETNSNVKSENTISLLNSCSNRRVER